MSRAACCAALLALGACTAPEAPLRDAEAPLGATTRFDAANFAGRWHIVASSDPSYAGVVEVSTTPAGVQFTGALAGAYRETSPAVLGAPDGTRLVIMWIDEGFRTAALGSASGDRAFLLARGRTVPADKRAAAFDVFDFYGWNTALIRERMT